MRRAECRLLRTERCTAVTRFEISAERRVWFGDRNLPGTTEITHNRAAINAIALHDGFADATAMLDFFETTHGLPFRGWHVQWEITT